MKRRRKYNDNDDRDGNNDYNNNDSSNIDNSYKDDDNNFQTDSGIKQHGYDSRDKYKNDNIITLMIRVLATIMAIMVYMVINIAKYNQQVYNMEILIQNYDKRYSQNDDSDSNGENADYQNTNQN